jgi:hypothetical protein
MLLSRCFIVMCLLLAASTASAIQLFGIDLEPASRNQLRIAVKNAGVKLLREAGDDQFFDVYEAQDLLPGAKFLYLGFTKQDKLFAFAEYRFSGLKHAELLRRLRLKYGEPKVVKPEFITDYHYQWQAGAIQISLYSDWGSYATRLVYFEPQRLAVLRGEQKAFLSAVGSTQEFMQPAY